MQTVALWGTAGLRDGSLQAWGEVLPVAVVLAGLDARPFTDTAPICVIIVRYPCGTLAAMAPTVAAALLRNISAPVAISTAALTLGSISESHSICKDMWH